VWPTRSKERRSSYDNVRTAIICFDSIYPHDIRCRCLSFAGDPERKARFSSDESVLFSASALGGFSSRFGAGRFFSGHIVRAAAVGVVCDLAGRAADCGLFYILSQDVYRAAAAQNADNPAYCADTCRDRAALALVREDGPPDDDI